MSFDPKELGKVRTLLRRFPRPGQYTPARQASEYSIAHRYLDAQEMARRMVDVSRYFQIHTHDSIINVEEHWIRNIASIPERFSRGEKEIQHGIFFLREDKEFPGGIRVFADIGTILDGSIYETTEDS